ncbi:MAG: hypothetical protein QM638_17690 [Nocardioides sp.]|uniref:hypothetical protein n=1 Tax=Nocardioides sp. TaxID=35761 RepID=UPI0039E723CA
MNDRRAILGKVASWNAEEGTGSVSSDSLPSQAWFHASMLRGLRFEDMAIDRPCSFEYEKSDQDGYAYRATVLWKFGQARPDDLDNGSDAGIPYESSLRIDFDS